MPAQTGVRGVPAVLEVAGARARAVVCPDGLLYPTAGGHLGRGGYEVELRVCHWSGGGKDDSDETTTTKTRLYDDLSVDYICPTTMYAQHAMTV